MELGTRGNVTAPHRPVGPQRPVPTVVRRRFEALVLDWDGTVVAGRDEDASSAARVIERLCALGMDVYIISGTNLGNVDGQLGARPAGPGQLLLCLNRGSEVFEVGAAGITTLYARQATASEDAALDRAARFVTEQLEQVGYRTRVVANRLNRRKVDLLPDARWDDPPKAEIAALLGEVQHRLAGVGIEGLAGVVRMAQDASVRAGLPGARITSDAKHVEIGLTDKADSAAYAFARLERAGIGAGLVLIIGDEFGELGGVAGSDSLLLGQRGARATAVSVGVEPAGVPDGVVHLGGGPPACMEVLLEQLARRSDVPAVDHAPGWTLDVPHDIAARAEPALEALLTVSDGRMGSSGIPPAGHAGATPRVLLSGAYRGSGPHTDLVSAPLWQGICAARSDVTLSRSVDMRSGLVRYVSEPGGQSVDAMVFSCLHRPGTGVLRAAVPPAYSECETALRAPVGTRVDRGDAGPRSWMRTHAGEAHTSVAAARTRLAQHDGRAVVDRVACLRAGDDVERVLHDVDAAWGLGSERLLREHRAAWANRWAASDVVIDGDDDLQLAVRFCLYHLIGAVPVEGEAAVGARGLTGPAYRGHVFWDADVFVLPFLAATCPPAARAMLEYRVRRLTAARELASAMRRSGARFPWESAGDGRDVTPSKARDLRGELVAIRAGRHEEHITADVAWAANHYATWSGDEEFEFGAGRVLAVETARYWASRIRTDRAGVGHILGVVGPDEYHDVVDDNMFTNEMARWNLRHAAAAAGDLADDHERLRWLDLARSLADSYRPDAGVHEQFTGFFDLDPVRISDLFVRPVVADQLLGRERVASSQIIKQADVLMAHLLIPDHLPPGSLHRDLSYYEPRTAHGSSLSPGVHATLLARAGRLEEAVEALHVAARIDLDDLTDTTAAGVHLAAMGSVWQALAWGFAGIRPGGNELWIDPHLPAAWRSLEVRVGLRGVPICVRVEHDRITVRADAPAVVRVGGVRHQVGLAGLQLVPDETGWRSRTP